MADLRVYYTSVTGSREVKHRQSEVFRILDGNCMKYQLVDVSLSESLLQEMRDKVGKADAVPPQIFNGDEYCGDFEMLYEAIENEEIKKFLKVAAVARVGEMQQQSEDVPCSKCSMRKPFFFKLK